MNWIIIYTTYTIYMAPSYYQNQCWFTINKTTQNNTKQKFIIQMISFKKMPLKRSSLVMLQSFEPEPMREHTLCIIQVVPHQCKRTTKVSGLCFSEEIIYWKQCHHQLEQQNHSWVGGWLGVSGWVVEWVRWVCKWVGRWVSECVSKEWIL